MANERITEDMVDKALHQNGVTVQGVARSSLLV
jgi:hypothetical protein